MAVQADALPVVERASLLPLVLIIYLTLLPPQALFAAGDVVFPFYRLALVLILPWVIFVYVKSKPRLSILDGLMLFAAGWVFVALSMTEGTDRAIQNGGATFLDVTASYFLARYSIRTPQDLRRVLVYVAPGFALAAASILLETVSGRYVVQPFMVRLFGSAGSDYVFELAEKRFGLVRATGVFPHPILAGLHMASLVPIYLTSRLRGWPLLTGTLAGLSTLLTFSSAALIMLVTQAGGLVYNRITQIFPQLSWRLLISVAVFALLILEVVSDRGAVRYLASIAALDPWTAYYRTLIWDYGTLSVQNHPLFGIGFADWQRAAWMRNDSIDNYWLLLAIQYGLPEAIARISVPMVGIVVLGFGSVKLAPIDEDLARGLMISLFFFTLLGFSVALWNNTQVWFSILCGAIVTLGQFAWGSQARPT